MVGFFIPTQNYGWANATSMERPDVCIHFSLRSNLVSLINTLIISILPKNRPPSDHMIIYTNFCSLSENIDEKLSEAPDKYSLMCGIILINGLLFKEQMFYLSKLFVGTHTSHLQGLFHKCWSPQQAVPVLGIDCHTVHNIIFHGFPPFIIDLAQALGCTGRRENGNPDSGNFFIVASLDEFLIY